MVLRARNVKRLGTIVLMTFLATSYYLFLPNERGLSTTRSLSNGDVADDIASKSNRPESDIEALSGDGCWRKCHQGRINRIFYNGLPGTIGAGMSDKKFVTRDLAELAGYLCAKLVLTKPYTLLSSEHNNGKPLSPNYEWKDIWNPKFLDDDKSIIIEDESDVDVGYEGYLRVVSTGALWKDGFEKVQEYSWKQDHDWRQGEHNTQGFVWELLSTVPYHNDLTVNDLPMLKEDLQKMMGHHYNHHMMKPQVRLGHGDSWKPAGCQYTNNMSDDMKDEIPEKILMMKKRLTQQLQELSPDTTFGRLHLRRGDAINECDTSIAKVKEFLSCSLKNTEEKGHLTILLVSDEKDDQYRQDILDLANDYSHVTMMDLDKLNVRAIDEAVQSGELDASLQNNYFEFDVERRLDIFEFYLDRRRAVQCDDCTPLTGLNIK